MSAGRVIWKNEKVRCECAKSGFARTPRSKGGTCAYNGGVFVYDEIPETLKVEGGRVLYISKYNQKEQDICCLCKVEAVFDREGKQLY